MSQQVTITISAKDGASQTFVAVGRSAETMASTAQRAGQTAADGIAKIDKQASLTQGSLGKLGKGFDIVTGAAAGLVGSAVVGFLSDSARAAAESEAVMARLETAVGNTGQAFSDLEPSINAALDGAEQLAFDGEDAADALSVLTSTTGDASQALDLLGLTMDIARGRGVDLATAAQAVGKAADGNVAALTRMGVAVADGATAQEALAAAQATFAGQSEAYAGTTQGAFDKLAVTFGNFQEQIGGMLGPMQTVIGLMPGLSSGFSAVAGALGGLQGAGGLSGLIGSLNPIALGFGAITVAVGLMAVAIFDANRAFDDMQTSLGNVQSAINGVNVTALQGALSDLAVAGDEAAYIKIDTGWFQNLADPVTEFNNALSTAIGTVNDTGASVDDFATVFGGLDKALHDQVVSLNDNTKALNDYQTVLNDTGPGAAAAKSQLDILNDAFASGVLGPQEYEKALGDLVTNLPLFDQAATEAAANVKTAQNALSTSIVGTRDEYDKLVVAANNQAATDAVLGERAKTARIEQEKQAEAARQLADTYRSQLVPGIDGAGAAFSNMAAPGEDVLDVLARLAGVMPNVNGQFAGLVDGLNDSASALDGVLGTFSQIDTLGQRSQSAVDIAQSVVGDPGVYAAVDDLLAAGRITLEEYNRAQADEVGIVANNMAIQGDLNAMRFNQISALAEATTGYAEYIGQLSQAPAAEQAVALAMMDTGTQAQIAAAYSATYSATLGEIPKDVATDIVASSAAADPVLFDVYEKLGLISQGANGEIIVNFPDQSQIALDKFTAAFGEGNVTKTADGLIEVTQSDGTTLVYDQFNNLVDKQVTASVNVDLNDPAGLLARGGGGAAANDINAAAMNLSDTAVTISVTADSSQFDNTLATARNTADAFEQAVFTADIAANAEQWDGTLAATTEAGAAFDAALYVADLAANAEQWDGTLTATNADGAAFDATTFIAELAGNREQWDGTLTATIGAGQDFDATVFAADLDADTRNFDAKIANLRGATLGTVYMEVEPKDANANIPGGFALGGTIRSESISGLAKIWPTAARGRTVLVGEAGPELAFLPYGAQVMPSTPSRSRMAADAQNGGMRFYGPVHIHAATPDIQREIQRQLATRSRA